MSKLVPAVFRQIQSVQIPGSPSGGFSFISGLSLAALIITFGLLASPVRAQDGAPSRADATLDEWTAWKGNFDGVISACVKAGESSCLSRAFASRARPALEGSPPDVADSLYRDLRTAEVLLHQKDARDLLWREYGIDGSDYLGTGYSVPLTGPTARNYEYALQREYFVPNLCAEAIDPAVCPRRDANIWTWRLTTAQLSRWLDKPIAKFLHAYHPASDAAGFDKRTAFNAPAAPGPLPTLLIRFGNLPLANYKGTFGRPGAVRVFFADYDLVRTKTLRGAVIATGAATLLDNSGPAKTFFIWIYAPDAKSFATVASWNALFTILAQPTQ